LENRRQFPAAGALPRAAAVSPVASVRLLVWIAFGLGVASAVPGMVLGLFGLPLGVAAAGVSLVALLRLTGMPREQRRGEMLTLLGLGFGVFQVVFVLVGFYVVNWA
jgi:hypothetical protein